MIFKLLIFYPIVYEIFRGVVLIQGEDYRHLGFEMFVYAPLHLLIFVVGFLEGRFRDVLVGSSMMLLSGATAFGIYQFPGYEFAVKMADIVLSVIVLGVWFSEGMTWAYRKFGIWKTVDN